MTLPRLRMFRVRRYMTFRVALHLRMATRPGLANPPAFFLRWLP